MLENENPHSDGLGAHPWRGIAAIASVAIVVACLYSVLTWGLPFYTKGEPREAIEIQAIVAGESVLVPLRNGGEIPSKPPLFHWIGAAASLAMGGVTEYSSRLPSILGAAGCVFLTGVLGARLYGMTAGLAAAVLLASAQLFVVGGTCARVDMVLALFVTAALTSFASTHFFARRKASHLLYLACALAILAKGPVGVVLPAAIIGAYLLIIAREPGEAVRLFLHPGLLWLALPIGWYGLAYAQGGQAFLDVQLFRENVFRVIDAERHDVGHAKAFWVYGPYLLAGFAPWSLFFPALGRFLWKSRDRSDQRGSGFLLTWIAVTVVLFSLAGSKRVIYLLPAYPAVAILLGRWWSLLGGNPDSLRASGRGLVAVSAWMLVAFVAVPTSLLLIQALGFDAFGAVVALTDLSSGDRANLAAAAETIADRHMVIAGWATASLTLAVVLATSIDRGKARAALIAAAGLSCLTTLVVSGVFARDIAVRQTTRTFAQEIAAASSGAAMYSFGEVEYEAIFYAGRPIVAVGDLATIENLADAVVFVRASLVEDLREQAALGHRLVTVEIARHVYAGSKHREPLIAARFQEVTRPTSPRSTPP